MKKDKNQEVEYKEKSGTAWSHSYLNQKPWHPLSYPNQRRKWIAEQTHAQRELQAAEVAREFAQEQDFFRQTSQMTKKEKEKMEQRQAVSFLYLRPPGYNAEAARAAEIADEQKRLGLNSITAPDANGNAGSSQGDTTTSHKDTKKARVKDVFGRSLPTEEEFPALKNGPRHETGGPVRLKPFAVEIRNVMCARCGAFGHQSGDRECTLKDVLMPNEEARLKREDPLNVILAQTSDEPLKWELKQQPGGLSPARGGFRPDDPNQQIIPDEDIYDEYGGFLAGGGEEGGLSIPNVLASLSREQRRELTDANIDVKVLRKKSKKSTKHKHAGRRRTDNNEEERGIQRLSYGEKHDSSDEERTRKRRHEKKSAKRDVSSDISDDGQKLRSRENEEQTKRRRSRGDKRKSAKREGERKKKLSPGDSDDDIRSQGSDDEKRHRQKNRPADRVAAKVRDVSPDYSDDDERSRKNDKKQRRKMLQEKGGSGKSIRKQRREVRSDESDDDQKRKHRRKDKRPCGLEEQK